MIGFWTDPYPDELFYSACARFQARMGLSASAVGVLLFGERVRASVEMPTRLSHFLKQLPPGNAYTELDLIMGTTMFPLHLRFMQPERAAAVAAAMREHAWIHPAAYGSTLKPPYNWRYCPVCSREDRETYGEAYWHRLHQVAGYDVCPAHNCRLEAVPFALHDNIHFRTYVLAESAIPHPCPDPRMLRQGDPLEDFCRWVAEQITWLVANEGDALGHSALRDIYLPLLKERRLLEAHSHLRVKAQALATAIDHQFRSEVLQWYAALVPDHRGSSMWAHYLTWGATRLLHPVTHLMMVYLLGATCSTISPQSKEVRSWVATPTSDNVIFERRTRATVSDGLATYRRRWLELQAQNPDLSRSELAGIDPKTKSWLYRHDRDWLDANSPEKRFQAGATLEELTERDRTLAARVESIAAHLKAMKDPLVHVTKTRILREMGQQHHTLSRLPFLRNALARSVESNEAFTLRRLALDVEECLRQGLSPAKWELIGMASLQPWLQNRRVVHALAEAVALLSEHRTAVYEAAATRIE